MKKAFEFAFLASLSVGLVLPAHAELRGPYAADAHTVALYHFDESPGAADPGNPIANHGTAGSALDLTDTGGPDGRDNTGGGGYQAAAFDSAFVYSFGVRASGDGSWYDQQYNDARLIKGGLLTAGAVPQSSLQGADGAFTYEAVVTFSAQNIEQEILAHDGPDGKRGFLFRLTSAGKLGLYPGGTGSVEFSLPSSGPHAFAANEWFHAAVTYTGAQGAAGNLKLYWTRVGSGAVAANLLGTGTLANDLPSASDSNKLGVGTTTRVPFRFQPVLVDEVRISSVARAASEFLFAHPKTTVITLH
jgi:hypothetical protein